MNFSIADFQRRMQVMADAHEVAAESMANGCRVPSPTQFRGIQRLLARHPNLMVPGVTKLHEKLPTTVRVAPSLTTEQFFEQKDRETFPKPKLSDWFPGTQAPWEPGIYEIHGSVKGNEYRCFARFTNEALWTGHSYVLKGKDTSMVFGLLSLLPGRQPPSERTLPGYAWRGFTTKQD